VIDQFLRALSLTCMPCNSRMYGFIWITAIADHGRPDSIPESMSIGSPLRWMEVKRRDHSSSPLRSRIEARKNQTHVFHPCRKGMRFDLFLMTDRSAVSRKRAQHVSLPKTLELFSSKRIRRPSLHRRFRPREGPNQSGTTSSNPPSSSGESGELPRCAVGLVAPARRLVFSIPPHRAIAP
jgi:hypothetical protein